MKEKFHITITYGSRQLVNCDSECAAFICENQAATCCTTNDIAVRIILASRVKVYLNSLLNTITADTHAFTKDMLESVIDKVVNDIHVDEKWVDPTQKNGKTLNEILKQLNKSLHDEGSGQ